MSVYDAEDTHLYHIFRHISSSNFSKTTELAASILFSILQVNSYLLQHKLFFSLIMQMV